MLLLKKTRWYILGAVISYVFIWFCLGSCLLRQKVQKIQKLKEEKEQLEYDYLRLKKSPVFLKKVGETVVEVQEKILQYTWLAKSPDPSLSFFEYLSDVLSRNKLVLQEMSEAKDEESGKKYFIWTVRVEGSYQNMIKAVHDLERGKKYLKITRIDITPGEKTVFNLTILGLKKVG